MKSLALSCLLTSTILFTGCQSFQFVDSPIPVTGIPAANVANQNTDVQNTIVNTPAP